MLVNMGKAGRYRLKFACISDATVHDADNAIGHCEGAQGLGGCATSQNVMAVAVKLLEEGLEEGLGIKSAGGRNAGAAARERTGRKTMVLMAVLWPRLNADDAIVGLLAPMRGTAASAARAR